MEESERIRLEISSPEDRRIVAGILASNGYSVRMPKMKIATRRVTVLEFWKEMEDTIK